MPQMRFWRLGETALYPIGRTIKLGGDQSVVQRLMVTST